MYYLLRFKDGKTEASHLPYIFKGRDEADRYRYESCLYPDEWEVVEAIEY